MHVPSESEPAVASADLRIREREPADSIVELTALLHRAYAGLAALGLNYTAVDQTPDVTAERIASGTCYVATQAGRVVGTLVVNATLSPEDGCAHYARPGVASVQQFAVEPGLQGGGIGQRLLRRAEAWARAGGFAELALDTAEPATHLVAFYGRLGFLPVGHVQWPGKVYRSVVMSKALA